MVDLAIWENFNCPPGANVAHTGGKYSGGIPCDHSPRPCGEIHCARKVQSSDILICDSPCYLGEIHRACLAEFTATAWWNSLRFFHLSHRASWGNSP